MFADSLVVLPIQNNEETFDVPISATTVSNHDRTFGVEVVETRSNAIEGKHYQIESNTVTIPAGEHATNLRIRGLYDNIRYGDSLRITLRLLCKEAQVWDLYGNEAGVLLKKCCPFDLNRFCGWAKMTSTYLMEYGTASSKLVYIEPDPEVENGLICRDYFYEGYDCHMSLNPSNPLNTTVSVPEQVFASTSVAFGTIYGNGKIMMNESASYTSYFNTCQGFIAHYMVLSVENVGTVGLFLSVLEMLSDAEYEQLKNEL